MTTEPLGEARTFHLWVFSDAHVATDRAVSAAIRNGMGFIPPAGYPESLANALRQSEAGGELGGPRSAGISPSTSATTRGFGIFRTMSKVSKSCASLAF
ncbi:MAG: hypothetical protein WDN31_18600 [Hyphomicrobium sp.]